MYGTKHVFKDIIHEIFPVLKITEPEKNFLKEHNVCQQILIQKPQHKDISHPN